jgi:hypothetical protein
MSTAAQSGIAHAYREQTRDETADAWRGIARSTTRLSPEDNDTSEVGRLETFPRRGDAGTFLVMRSAALQQAS